MDVNGFANKLIEVSVQLKMGCFGFFLTFEYYFHQTLSPGGVDLSMKRLI